MRRQRTNRSRIRGRRSCGMGARNNYRGKGMQGGKGMAGTGKRAGQKRTWVLKNFPDYFGKTGFTSRKTKMLSINIGFINDKIETLIKEKKAKKVDKGYEVELKNYKVLSAGRVDKKLFVKASGFSKKVEEKVVKAGGAITQIK
ncbi:MAG: uL15 family ribosomal protein [Candidatus Pacearchaeota archaeon]|nr:uL15 family ribosomal protein [Candidatus Pacearchaeota archaeon]